MDSPQSRQPNGESSFQQSPTARCPPEILSLIFQTALETLNPDYFQILYPGDAREDNNTILGKHILSLAAVCVRWRHVVFSTPRLWTAITIDVSPPTELKRTAFLRLCFENAKSLPLNLKISFTHFSGRDMSPFLNLILPNARNIRVLQLIDPPSVLLPLLNSSFPNMTGIYLSFTLWRPPAFSLMGASALDQITVKNVANLELLGCRVTYLNLEFVPIDICVKLIFQCPNLIEYHSRNPVSPTANTADLPNKVVLSHLKIFGWSCSRWCHSWDNIIFDRLHLPSIRELVFFGWLTGNEDDAYIDEFMTRTSQSLSKLHIQGFTPFHHYYCVPIFARPNPIEHLTLIKCSLGYILRILSALIAPQQSPGSTENNDSSSLRSLSLITERPLGTDVRLASTIVKFLETRSGSSFSLQLVGTEISWSPEQADKIRLMLQENSDLEVTQRPYPRIGLP